MRLYRSSPLFERLINLAAELTDTEADQIRSSRRDRPTLHARFAVYWAARHGLGLSLPRIGDEIGGREHCTIIHGLRRAEQLRAQDSQFRSLSDRLLAVANEGCGR